MEYTNFSINRLNNSMEVYSIDETWQEPLRNYLIHGFSPGGFLTSALANNFVSAIAQSHPSNTVSSLKPICTWLLNYGKDVFWGSYQVVEGWIKMSQQERRARLEELRLVYTEVEEFTLTLRS